MTTSRAIDLVYDRFIVSLLLSSKRIIQVADSTHCRTLKAVNCREKRKDSYSQSYTSNTFRFRCIFQKTIEKQNQTKIYITKCKTISLLSCHLTHIPSLLIVLRESLPRTRKLTKTGKKERQRKRQNDHASDFNLKSFVVLVMSNPGTGMINNIALQVWSH